MNIGKKGEAKLATLIAKVAQVEDKVDFKKPTYTNAPDDGVDFELRGPHNLPEKLDKIISRGETKQSLSKSTIDVRIDHKEYSRKIGKPTAEKFVSDIEKNKKFDEHWLTGGLGLTSGAKNVFDKANESNIVRYYSADNINTIEMFYDNELKNENDLD